MASSFNSSLQPDDRKQLTLFFPDYNAKKEKFYIRPSQSFRDIVDSITDVLKDVKEPETWPHDVNGEELFDSSMDPHFNFNNLEAGEELIIALKKSTRVRGQLKLETELFREAEQGAGLQKALRESLSFPRMCEYRQAISSPHQKNLDLVTRREYLRSLRRRDGTWRVNISRTVLSYSDIKEQLNALHMADAHMIKNKYFIASSYNNIKKNWRASSRYDLGPKIMALIDILSQALCGQHLHAEDLLNDARKARIEGGGSSEPRDYLESDVLSAIHNLYTAGNALYPTWANTPDNILIGKRASRLAAYKARKAQAADVARANAAREQMGQDAAEAAFPGKGKDKAIDYDLADRLQNTALPDSTIPDDASDDSEPVRPPGRMRRG